MRETKGGYEYLRDVRYMLIILVFNQKATHLALLPHLVVNIHGPHDICIPTHSLSILSQLMLLGLFSTSTSNFFFQLHNASSFINIFDI